VDALLEIAKQVKKRTGQEREHFQILLRAREVVYTFIENHEGDWLPRKLSRAWAQAQEWEYAKEAISKLRESIWRVSALGQLGKAMLETQQWGRAEELWLAAEELIGTIEAGNEKARAFSELGQALAQAQQWGRAEELWEAAEELIGTIEAGEEKARAFSKLGQALAQAQQW